VNKLCSDLVELQGTPLYFCFLISLIVRLTVSPCLVCRFVLTECDFIITIIVIDLEIIHCEFGGGDGFVACTKLCLTVLFYTSVYIYIVHPLFLVAEVKFLFTVILYYRFNEFGADGGPAAKALRPKFDAFTHRVHSQVGFQVPPIDVSLPSLSIICVFLWKIRSIYHVFISK